MSLSKYQQESARRDAAEWLEQAAKRFETAAAEMRRYKESFERMCREQDEGTASFKPSSVMSWAITATTNVLPNLRLTCFPASRSLSKPAAIEEQHEDHPLPAGRTRAD